MIGESFTATESIYITISLEAYSFIVIALVSEVVTSRTSFFCVFMNDLKVALLSTFLGGVISVIIRLALLVASSNSSFCFDSS